MLLSILASILVSHLSSNNEIKFFKIPKGTTRKIQPLDEFRFRIWKNFVSHFSDSVNSDVNLHLKNNIIKLQSLVHNIRRDTFLNRDDSKVDIDKKPE